MRPLLTFEEYLKEGIVKKQRAELPRARFLIEESEKSFLGLKRRIKNEGIDSLNANSIIKEIHDIIIELIRAKMLLDEFSASGNYAHEAEISYLRALGFSDKEVLMANELRKARNGITYYGKMFEVDYARQSYSFLEVIYPKLRELLKSLK